MNGRQPYNQHRVRGTGRGFSLIELVAVMTVAAILAAIAIPSLSSTASMRGRAAAAQVARDLRVARELGVLTGRRTWVVFDVPASAYQLRVEPIGNPGRLQAEQWLDPATGRGFQQELAAGQWEGVSLVGASIGGGTWVGFDARGRPLNHSELPLSTPAQITLTGPLVVSVEPESGHVEVSP